MAGPSTAAMDTATTDAYVPRVPSHNDSLEDEPWDQCPSAISAGGSGAMGQLYGQKASEIRGGNGGYEGLELDDGELPSLSATGFGSGSASNSNGNNSSAPTHISSPPSSSSSGGGRLVGVHQTTSRPLKPASEKGLKSSPDVGRRNFWGQMEHSEQPSYDKSDGMNEQQQQNEPMRRLSTKSKSGRRLTEEDGPDDEMEARRADKRNRQSAVPSPQKDTQHLQQQHIRASVKSYDTDNSAPTDVESQLTEEEEDEEERYQTTFCGQTLNAIGDICGGNLNLTGGIGSGRDRENAIKERQQIQDSAAGRQSLNQRTASLRSIDGNEYGTSARKSSPRSSRSPPSQRDDLQQENTAIEVEFVEPVKPVLSADSQDKSVSDVQKKTAYLNAIAKKAKENFQNKKAKQQMQKSTPIGDAQQRSLSQGGGVGRVLVDVEESATVIASSANAEGTVLDEDDYNSFNATEKRKFIKLINNGVTAGAATRQILEDRSIAPSAEPEKVRSAANIQTNDERDGKDRLKSKAAAIAARLPFWKRSQDAELTTPPLDVFGDAHRELDSVPGAENQYSISQPVSVDPISELLATAAALDRETEQRAVDTLNENKAAELNQSGVSSVSEVDSIPFEKSGSHYYDAVRRDFDDESSYDVGGDARGIDFKGLDIARAQRFFGGGKQKTKGFAALPNSPQRRSISAPRERLDEPEQSRRIETNPFADGIDATSKPAETNPTTKPAETNPFADGIDATSKYIETNPFADDLDATRKPAETNPFAEDFDTTSKPAYGAEIESENAGNLALCTSLMDYEQENDEVIAISVENISKSMFQNGQDESYAQVFDNETEPVVLSANVSKDITDQMSPQTTRNAESIGQLDSDALDLDMQSSPDHVRERGVDFDDGQPTSAFSSPPEHQSTSMSRGIPVVSPSSPRQAEHPGPDVSDEVSMDTYFKSTADNYSVSDGTHQNDNVSVYTSGTNVTGATSYTQSSRVRRPGVAKTRLAKQKQIEQRASKLGKGWHETIRSAAETTHRTWDIKRGWVDYEAPDEVTVDPHPVIKEKIHIDLDRNVLSPRGLYSNSAVSAASGPAVTPVPFPEEWEKERDAMIHSKPLDESSGGHIQADNRDVRLKNTNGKPGATGVGGYEQESAFDSSDTNANGNVQLYGKRNEGSMPKGWLESMRTASASLAKQGKNWDPVNGWTSEDRNDVPNTVDFDFIDPADEEAEHLRELNVLDSEHNLPVVGNAKEYFEYPVDVISQNDQTATPRAIDMSETTPFSFTDQAPLTHVAAGSVRKHPVDFHRDMDNYMPSAAAPELNTMDSVGVSRFRFPERAEDAGKKLNLWMAKKTEQVPNPNDRSETESSNLAVVSGTAISIEESDDQLGSVVPMKRHKKPRGTDWKKVPVSSSAGRSFPFLGIKADGVKQSEYDTAPLIIQSNDFNSLDDRNIVDVVKERVEEQDLNLFTEDSKSPHNSRGRMIVSPRGIESSRTYINNEGMELAASPSAPSNISATLSDIPANMNKSGEPVDVDSLDENWAEQPVSLSKSKPSRTNASILSADQSSVATSRRGGGPIDTDEVDETWDSDDDARHSKDWRPDNAALDITGETAVSTTNHQVVQDDENDHRHISDWKDNPSFSMKEDTKISPINDIDQGKDSIWSTPDVSPLKRVPKLQRSKRDTSPLSVRKAPEGGLLRYQDEDQIVRHHPSSLSEKEWSSGANSSGQDSSHTSVGVDVENNTNTVPITTSASTLPSNEHPRGEFGVLQQNDRDVSRGSGYNSFPTDSLPKHSFPDGSKQGRVDNAYGAFSGKSIQSPVSPSVKDRLQVWGTRIETANSSDGGESIDRQHTKSKPELQLETSGWKTFLEKKVQAVSAAASASLGIQQSDINESVATDGLRGLSRSGVDGQVNNHEANVHKQIDDDSLFEFVNKKHGVSDPNTLNMSDLSPIHLRDDLSDAEIAESEAYGPTEDERRSSSFLQRLSECAAPIMAMKQSSSEFRPTGTARFVPTTLCGGHDSVEEPESVADNSNESLNSAERHRRSMSFGDEKPRSRSHSNLTSDNVRVSSSSVVSEDFGAKTAYLDSVAIKAAVSKSRRSRSGSSARRREQSSGGSVASNATDHSEKWKAFLERKKASDPSSTRSRASSSDVSRAAEKYAAQKVDEIMTKMASRSRTVTRSREMHKEIATDYLNDMHNAARSSQRAQSSINDAEDLAAARVEAMMAALSTSHLDEGEI